MTLNDASAQPLLGGSAALISDQDSACIESFRFDGSRIIRTIRLRNGGSSYSTVANLADANERDARAGFDQSYLRSTVKTPSDHSRGSVRIVDLFCGAGGASLGVDEACRALGLDPVHVFASDINEDALRTYTRNFSPKLASPEPIESRLDGVLGCRLTSREKAFKKQVGQIDLAIGGPPCQGHSNLNNHTRRDDPKNSLYAGVRHDLGGVYATTLEKLQQIGYTVVATKLAAHSIGVPQRRHREIVVASLDSTIDSSFFADISRAYACEERSVGWAIGDLVDNKSGAPIDAKTNVSKVSQDRIDWLFDHNEYDLPDRMRPDCHKLNVHSYKSVYGRLFWDRPAWTITTGFQVMGQGRFLHPLRRRVITSHEAARLQFIPDYFSFATESRKGFAKMIGNAVPSKVAYVLACELLR
jgi:DNA (cytosine-5)-methyltransferase 1